MAALLLPALAGCGVLFPHAADPARVERLQHVAYPDEAPLGEDLDLVAIQTGNNLYFVNRTLQSYRNVYVWLNQQYVADINVIPIGRSALMPLSHFINHHGEPFPTAGLLTPDRGFPVVSVEMFNPATGQRHRLLARQE